MKGLPIWRKSLFVVGFFLLLCTEGFEFVLPHVYRLDQCGLSALYVEIPFLIALASLFLVLFGNGWLRWAVAAVALVGTYAWFSQLTLAASAC
jgi:hypothetical protein